MSQLISSNIKETENNIDNVLNIGMSFDLIKKDLFVGGKKAAIYFINGFCSTELMERIQEFLVSVRAEQIPQDIYEFNNKLIPYTSSTVEQDQEKIITGILSGVVCLVVDGYDSAIMLDCRMYPMRGVEEPEKYRVLRGSRDGFVETLISNTALIRRRIRSTDYVCEILNVGKSSRTDIAICYMKSRVDRKMLDEIRRKIKEMNTDALSLNQESLAERLHKGHWFNPLPKFRYTERPDTTSASILEGQIAIMVDNSPAAMLLPTTIFDVIEEADDYYFSPITGSYLRFSRLAITLVSLYLTPVFLLFTIRPELIPEWLAFVRIVEPVNIPVLLQLLMLELSVDGLKLAAINTPSMLNTPLSLIAALVIGEFAVNTGWFTDQTMLYMAVVAIANFTHENFEFSYAIKFFRLINLFLVQFFGIYGLIAGTLVFALSIAFNKTIAGTSYIYPLIPFDCRKFLERFVRVKRD